MDPIIHTIADGIGHVDLNKTRMVFGTPNDMLRGKRAIPAGLDPRALILAGHRDFAAANPEEFIFMLGALIARWSDREIWIWSETALTRVYGVYGETVH